MAPRPVNAQFAEIRSRLVGAGLAAAAIVAVGTFGYWVIGGGEHRLLDAMYMTVITLTTVGYGEIVALDTHPWGRVFTMVLLLFGMGVLVYFASTVTAFLVEGQLRDVFGRRRMRRAIGALRDHFVVCGSGIVAAHVLEELRRVQRHAVAIVPAAAAPMPVSALSDLLTVEGDPAEESVLREAGVERAAGIVPALESDRDNVLVVLTARQLNPAIRIVAMVTDAGNATKLQRAGADAIVNPPLIGGMRLASVLIRPAVVTFLDRMLRDQDRQLRVEEVVVGRGSPAAGRRVADLKVNDVPGVLLVALAMPDGSYRFKPSDDTVVAEDARLIVMGGVEGVAELRRRYGRDAVSPAAPV
jgi:voltage-gated potassium channel